MPRKYINLIFFILLIPVTITILIFALSAKAYALISILVAFLACIPFFISFERKQNSVLILVITAVMIALSVSGRLVFSLIPHFKPVTAIVIITGIYLGTESGFICGAFSALISNFIFGQGPWTPFQMLAWGLIGFFAACLAAPLKKSRIFLSIFAALSGAFFSLIMDLWTTLWASGGFAPRLYFSLVAAALPVTAIYAVSDVIFLNLLEKPIGKKLNRTITKYG